MLEAQIPAIIARPVIAAQLPSCADKPLPFMEWPGQMDGDERKGYTGKGDTVLSAKEWAQLRLVWLASKRDVLRGYRERIDLTAILLRVAVILLAGYSIYLLYCES